MKLDNLTSLNLSHNNLAQLHSTILDPSFGLVSDYLETLALCNIGFGVEESRDRRASQFENTHQIKLLLANLAQAKGLYELDLSENNQLSS